jgi:hypothetical protein
MNKIYILLAILFLFEMISYGQKRELFVALNFHQYEEQTPEPKYWGAIQSSMIGYGFSFPVYRFSNDMILGAYTNLNIGLGVVKDGSLTSPFMMLYDGVQLSSSEIGVSGHLNVPFYLTLGYGAGTRRHDNKDWGVKGGLGVQYSRYLVGGAVLVDCSNVSPVLLTEFVFNAERFGLLNSTKFRYERQLGRWSGNGYVDLSKDKGVIGFYQQSISLIFIPKRYYRQHVYDLRDVE